MVGYLATPRRGLFLLPQITILRHEWESNPIIYRIKLYLKYFKPFEIYNILLLVIVIKYEKIKTF